MNPWGSWLWLNQVLHFLLSNSTFGCFAELRGQLSMSSDLILLIFSYGNVYENCLQFDMLTNSEGQKVFQVSKESDRWNDDHENLNK